MNTFSYIIRSDSKIYDSERLSMILGTPGNGIGFVETRAQTKTHIEQENSEPTDVVRCIYCGAEINKLNSNNPYNNGLHPEYDKYTNISPRYTCGNCKRVEAKWLEDHAEELSEYYLKQKKQQS